MAHRDYRWLMRVRPEIFAAFLKNLLRVKRMEMRGPAGSVLWADPVTLLGANLQESGVYEPEMTRLITALLRSHDTFIDVGANEGYFSVLAALVANEGKVFSIEPQITLRPVIGKNFRLNGIVNADVENVALSDAVSEATLYLRTSINNGASRIDVPHKGMGRRQTVTTLTLSRLLEQKNVTRARIIKIDCEGGEYKILTGSRELFQNRQFDFVLLEYHFNVLTREQGMEIHQLLSTAGYSLAKWQDQTIYYLASHERDLAAVSPEIQLAAKF